MPLSKFPELAGALFPSEDALQLAEKKILAQRAEKARLEEEERQRLATEERQQQEKAARIEAKRIQNEKRLQEIAKEKARAVEEEAERMRQQLIQQKEEEKRRQEEQRQAEARAAEQLRQQQEEERKKREAAEQERNRRLEQEKERKRQEMIKRKQQEERDAEIRWITQQINLGRVVVGKRRGYQCDEFYVHSTEISDVSQGEVLDWIQSEFDLPANAKLHDDIEKEEKKKEIKKKEAAKALPRVVAHDKKWKKSETDFLSDAVTNFRPDQSLDSLRRKMHGIVDRLDDKEDRYDALLHLHAFLTRLLAEKGRLGLLEEATAARTAAAIIETPHVLGKFLRETPGNMYALVVLGIQRFAGDDVLQDKVRSLNVVPDTVDEWLGQLIAVRLFFDFVLWKQNGAPPRSGWEVLEFEPETPAHGSALMYHSCHDKLVELVAAYNLPDARTNDVPTMLSAYDRKSKEYFENLKSLQTTLSNLGGSIDVMKQDDADRLQTEYDDLKTKLEFARKDLKRAQDELENKKRNLNEAISRKQSNNERLDMLQRVLAE